VFRDPEVFAFLTQLLLNSKATIVRRPTPDPRGGSIYGTLTLYMLAARVIHRSLQAEKHWPIELIDVYLHDSLGKAEMNTFLINGIFL
jgi:hypothetical protein